VDTRLYEEMFSKRHSVRTVLLSSLYPVNCIEKANLRLGFFQCCTLGNNFTSVHLSNTILFFSRKFSYGVGHLLYLNIINET